MTTSGPELLPKSLFTQYFTTLKEPRRTTKGNFQYPLEEILFLTISSIISGWFEEWDDITFFGENNLIWLRKFYPFVNGIPSHDVLNKLFNRLDTNLTIVLNNSFIMLTSSNVEVWEKEYGVPTNQELDLSYKKRRVLAKMFINQQKYEKNKTRSRTIILEMDG